MTPMGPVERIPALLLGLALLFPPAAVGDGAGDRTAVGKNERIVRSRGLGGAGPQPADAEAPADPLRRFPGRPGDVLSRMRGLMDRLFQNDPLRGWGPDPFGDPAPRSGGGVAVRESEDKDFKYIVVEGGALDEDGLGVKVQDGRVLIFGEARRTAGGPGRRSTSVSSFRRSLPVPDGVDPSGVAFEHDKDKVVIKFPKA